MLMYWQYAAINPHLPFRRLRCQLLVGNKLGCVGSQPELGRLSRTGGDTGYHLVHRLHLFSEGGHAPGWLFL